jgi:hypothetical protein
MMSIECVDRRISTTRHTLYRTLVYTVLVPMIDASPPHTSSATLIDLILEIFEFFHQIFFAPKQSSLRLL